MHNLLGRRTHRRICVGAATVAALAISPTLACGATTTWNGAAGNNLWGDPGNWTNGVPDADTDAFFGTLTFGGNINLGGVARPARSVAAFGGIERQYTLVNGTLRTDSVNAGSSLHILSALTAAGDTLHLSGGGLTIGGSLVGSNQVNFEPSGMYTLTGAATHSGTTIVRGNLVVNNGTFNNARQIRVERGRLELTGVNAIRGTNDLVFHNGQVAIHSNISSAALELAPGEARIESGSHTLTAASLRRSPGAVAKVVAEMWISGTTASRIQFNTAPPLSGDNASPTRLPVAPWAYGRNSVEYGLVGRDASGLRPLNPNTEYANTLANGENVRLTANTTAAPGVTPNSLTLGAASLTVTADLTIASGALVLNPLANADTPTSAVIGAGSLSLGGEGFIYANRNTVDTFPDVVHRVDVPITAGSLTKAGDASLVLSKSNMLPGGLTIAGGRVTAAVPASLGAGPVTFGRGELVLGTANTTINNALVLSGEGRLRLPSGNTTWAGDITGAGSLRITSDALGLTPPFENYVLRLTSPTPAADAATLHVHGSTLVADTTFGNPNSQVFAGGGVGLPAGLYGNGSFPGYVQHTNAVVSPGPPGSQPGRLTEGRSAFFGSTLHIDLAGHSAAVDYDQLVVLDSLLLSTNPVNDNMLEVALAPGFAPAVDQVFTIIDNRFVGPVDGYFAASNLPEGAVVTPIGGGTRFRISYAGGDGNDVTLTAVPEPVTLPLLGACSLTLMARRQRRSRVAATRQAASGPSFPAASPSP